MLFFNGTIKHRIIRSFIKKQQAKLACSNKLVDILDDDNDAFCANCFI